MRPIIGITCKNGEDRSHPTNYIRAVEEYNGTPIILFPDGPEVALGEMDGLLLTGGGDIHPDHFNQAWHPKLLYVDEKRDALEIPLCQEALDADIPVFGVCRGIQIMNVATGGSLYQDIKTEYRQDALPHKKVKGKDSQHEIEIEPGSRLSEIIAAHQAVVNSAHHQALDEIGEGFVVTARSTDGIIEAIEAPSKQFAIGVQYHPERMTDTAEFRKHRRKLFETFIRAAAE